MRTPLGQLTLLPRSVMIGAISTGIAGGVAGLIIGLFTYAPTAAFAVVELGLPATLLGAVAGLIVGSIILVVRRFDRRHPSSTHRPR